jgi:hypothetical protein
MALIIISVIVILITALFLIIGGKIRDKFEFDKSKDEVVVEVNDSVKLLRKNNATEYTDGILYLTNKRFVFFKFKYNWLGIIPFIGGAFISIFIDKHIYFELPLHQIKHFTYKPKITYHNNRVGEQEGLTTIYTILGEEFEFDIFVLGMAQNKVPEILLQLEKQLKKTDI